jgi:hypothetical protein
MHGTSILIAPRRGNEGVNPPFSFLTVQICKTSTNSASSHQPCISQYNSFGFGIYALYTQLLPKQIPSCELRHWRCIINFLTSIKNFQSLQGSLGSEGPSYKGSKSVEVLQTLVHLTNLVPLTTIFLGPPLMLDVHNFFQSKFHHVRYVIRHAPLMFFQYKNISEPLEDP